MPLNTFEAVIKMRYVVIFPTAIWLALASLSSATARFPIVLRDRAKFNVAAPSDAFLGIAFPELMDDVLVDMVVVAQTSAPFSIFGVVLVIYPQWLQENCKARDYYGYIAFVLSLVVLCLGGYIATRVRGFRTSFEPFGSESHFLYYKVMYYGAVGQAALGSLVVIVSLVLFVVHGLCGH